MEAIGGGGGAAAAAATSSARPSILDGRAGISSTVVSEADDSVEETGMTEEDEEEDEEDEPDGKPRADSVASAGASVGKSKRQSPGKTKKRARLGESEDDPQESTADEEDEEDEDEVADDEEEEDDEDEDDKASAIDVDEEEDEEEGAEDPGRVDASDGASMLRMVRSLPEEEARRHEQFRRSHFERGAVKRAIQEASGSDRRVPSVTNVMAIVMAGMTKVFVGEITAEARRIMDKNGETGPIRPRHLREAHRRYYRRRPLARGRNLRRLFR